MESTRCRNATGWAVAVPPIVILRWQCLICRAFGLYLPASVLECLPLESEKPRPLSAGVCREPALAVGSEAATSWEQRR